MIVKGYVRLGLKIRLKMSMFPYTETIADTKYTHSIIHYTHIILHTNKLILGSTIYNLFL